MVVMIKRGLMMLSCDGANYKVQKCHLFALVGPFNSEVLLIDSVHVAVVQPKDRMEGSELRGHGQGVEYFNEVCDGFNVFINVSYKRS